MNDHDCRDLGSRPCTCRESIRISRSPESGHYVMSCPLTDDRIASTNQERYAGWDLTSWEGATIVFQRNDVDLLDAEAWVRGELNPSDFEVAS